MSNVRYRGLLVAVLFALFLGITGAAWAVCVQAEGQITAIDSYANQLTLATSEGTAAVQVTPDTVMSNEDG